MKRKDITFEDVEFNRRQFKHKISAPLELPEGTIGIEDPIWYDGICMYQAPDGTKYSKIAHIPIEEDEMCKYGNIYKVELIKHSDSPYDYDYKILSKRPDVNVD